MDNSSLPKDLSDLRALLWVVTGLVLGILFGFLSGFITGGTITDILESAIEMAKHPLTLVQLLIIVSVFFYNLLWAHNGTIEINAIEGWISPPPNYIPRNRFLFIISSIFIGVFLALLMIFSTRFIFFAFAVLIYCIL